ncbi:unnamed protein product [Acanthoscelides obtectus]|uniref:Transferrin n=1 Tax=Acanthoscelides obtectus TaxID=200917 RepID=A0A9P0JSQ0_ACAOB|nr:unnamed protein product [Acanthoscelides obtectus]CAK1663793.1 hypothetical protein AOBTE_LOCUS23858 [Acanthoscelides obtectus]
MCCFARVIACIVMPLVFLSQFGVCKKYRVCIVDGKGNFKKSAKYCPDLDKPESGVECVLAFDRLDCLRRISKGTVDFSVFAPEDLLASVNAGVDLLVTNELRYTNEKFEYEVVAVIDNNSRIKSKHDLRGKRLCHPGFGYETDWNKILANYFEASVVIPSCDPKLAVTENRIKASSKFFSAACKAGPWVHNPFLEKELKRKYSNLCALCGSPGQCSTQDEYWGRRGPLFCLTDGAGDVAWARKDDMAAHFGLTGGRALMPPEDYSLLCPDDTLMPINMTEPCVWVVRPWPVIGANREKAQDIQAIVESLSHNDRTSWRYSLLNLLETSYTTFVSLGPVEAIETYLHDATGFLSANSFSGCHPPRTIKICTTSNIETAKCSWLVESAAVYGVEPDLACIKAENLTQCMRAVEKRAADIVLVPADGVHHAKREFNLTTLFYETVPDHEKYLTVAVVRSDENDISTIADLRSKKACFSTYDGIAWNTIKELLFKQGLIEDCPLDTEMSRFFGASCAPGASPNLPGSLKELCQQDAFDGEFGALYCLASGAGDVAFVSRNSIYKFVADEREDNPGHRLTNDSFKILFCNETTSHCHLSWSPIGQAMIQSNRSDLWISDTLDVFLQLNDLFGTDYPSLTNQFTLFGRFDGKSNVLFHDATLKLREVPIERNTNFLPNFYGKMMNSDKKCTPSSASKIAVNGLVIVLAFLIFY